MRRRLFVIAASIVVVIGLLIGIYFVFFGKSAQLSVTQNPFGGIGSDMTAPGPGDQGSGAGTEVAPRLIRISDRPVAEGVVTIPALATSTEEINSSSSTPSTIETLVHDTEVRFIDRASGNVYKYMARARSLTRLSNKTLPGIQRASWLPDGSVAYVQFLTNTNGDEHVSSYVLPDSGEGGFFLEQDLAQAQVVGSSTLFTLLTGKTGSVASVSKSDGTNARTLFTSLLSSIIVHPTRSGYFANTKPSWLLDGYAFVIGSGGGFERVLGPLRGLSSLPSPDGSQVLYSYVGDGALHLAVLDMASRTATALPVATLADKCTWSADGGTVYCGIPKSITASLPDDWYQGAASLTDRIWKIDMKQRLASLVVDPQAIGKVSIDAVSLNVDPNQAFLIFTDRTSGSLWAYEL